MVASFRIRKRMTKELDDGKAAYEEEQRHLVYKEEYKSEVEALYRHKGMKSQEHTQNLKKWIRRLVEDGLQQEELYKFFVQELGSSQIVLPDQHDNTVFQYLAGAKVPNTPLTE